MSTVKYASEAPIVSKQCTKLTPVSTKLEWRIEHFQKAMELYKRDQSFSSKTFSLPLPMPVIWSLDVFPHGIERYRTDNPFFNLSLTGFQTSDGTLSTDSTKRINTNYKIYLLSSTNKKSRVTKGRSEFKVPEKLSIFREDVNVISTVSLSMSAAEAKKFIHPDGSLLLICKVDCLTPEKTFYMKPTSNLQLTGHIETMWKNQLFADCTLKVGAKSFPAHKCILGQWSEVFHKMFSPPMEEAESGVVQITDFGPDAISAMLEYMYTGLVKDEVMDNLASDLLALSDKYAVFPLKEICEDYLASKLTTTNFLRIVILSDRYSAAKLKQACIDRLAIDGRAALESKEWEDFKNDNKDLSTELLELMLKGNLGFVDVQAKPQKTQNETLPWFETGNKTYSRKNKIIRNCRALAFWR